MAMCLFTRRPPLQTAPIAIRDSVFTRIEAQKSHPGFVKLGLDALPKHNRVLVECFKVVALRNHNSLPASQKRATNGFVCSEGEVQRSVASRAGQVGISRRVRIVRDRCNGDRCREPDRLEYGSCGCCCGRGGLHGFHQFHQRLHSDEFARAIASGQCQRHRQHHRQQSDDQR